MKICIPTRSNQGEDTAISEHFGSAPFFAIVDSETGAVEYLANDNQHHSHGMCQPLAQLQGRSIDGIVCGGIGHRALMNLNQQGIKVYRATAGTVGGVITVMKEGHLQEMSPESACLGHSCH